MRLNRWVRIGILLSVIWAVGAAIHTHKSDVERANYWVKLSYDTCTSGKRANHDADLSSCDVESRTTFKTWMEGSNTGAALVALAPIPFAWFAVFVLVYVVRAQIVGFCAVVPWETLPRPKKLFVAFCCICSALFVVIGVVAAMNLYVDTKVPVGMSSFQDLTKTGDGFVTVTGTWTRTDLTDDTIADPLQTSKIECDKAANRCTEALASVSGTTLMTDVVGQALELCGQETNNIRKAHRMPHDRTIAESEATECAQNAALNLAG